MASFLARNALLLLVLLAVPLIGGEFWAYQLGLYLIYAIAAVGLGLAWGQAGILSLGHLAAITNRHYLDCSGQIILHDRAGVGGIKSIFQSHEIDLEQNATTVGVIVVGVNAMTGTACTVLKDARLPDRSVLGAGSLLAKTRAGAEMPEQSLYAGVPARAVRHIDDLNWWRRDNYFTPVRGVDDSSFPLP